MNCPRCKKSQLRQQVSVYCDVDANCHNLSKKGIRQRDVKILGAGWPTAALYCPRCGFFQRLKG